MSPNGKTIVDLRAERLRLAEPLPAQNVIPLTLEAIEDGQHGLSAALGPILVVCERGPRAALAARYLRADGLDAEYWRGTWQELRQALDTR